MKNIVWLLCVIYVTAVALGAASSPSEKGSREDKAKAILGGKAGTASGSSPKDLLNPGQPVTTEIYADEAFFDSSKNIGKFTGHVKVVDPRFNMQSEKLTAYISKANQGLEKAVAAGNVGVIRDRPDAKGAPPMRSIGLSDNAIYTTSDGIVQLTGNPRVQQGLNMHVATSPDTVMLLNQDGQLTTRGPSRTEIRQQPSPSPSPSPGASESPSASPEGSASPTSSPAPSPSARP